MAKAGAPVGNKNAAKAKEWEAAIKYALENYKGTKKGFALREIGKKLIDMALDGDIQAIKEIGDRLDGKAVQAISGADGGSLVIEVLRFADTNTK